jgi:hypothetical protein
MEQEVQNNEPINEDQILSYTHGIRKKIVSSMMERGEVPKDIKEISTLAGVLSDMDRAALTNKRIKADEKANSNIAGAAGVVAHLLKSLKVSEVQHAPSDDVAIPEIPNGFELPSVSPDELIQGTSTTTYEDFAKQHFTKPTQD